ncbi:hypothetical protein ACP4OV_001370 [Aristida adscensionis]
MASPISMVVLVLFCFFLWREGEAATFTFVGARWASAGCAPSAGLHSVGPRWCSRIGGRRPSAARAGNGPRRCQAGRGVR